jgi:hypothetical protein
MYDKMYMTVIPSKYNIPSRMNDNSYKQVISKIRNSKMKVSIKNGRWMDRIMAVIPFHTHKSFIRSAYKKWTGQSSWISQKILERSIYSSQWKHSTFALIEYDRCMTDIEYKWWFVVYLFNINPYCLTMYGMEYQHLATNQNLNNNGVKVYQCMQYDIWLFFELWKSWYWSECWFD